MTIEQKKALFEIWVWKKNNTGSFMSKLLELFCKADIGNRLKLAIVYPEMYQAYEAWYASPNEEIFLDYCRTIKEGI